MIGEDWRGERTAFSTLLASLNWCDHAFAGELGPDATCTIALARNSELIGRLINGLETAQLGADRAIKDAVGVLQLDIASTFSEQVIDECDLRLVAQKLAVMAAASDRYDEWASLKRLRGQLETGNLHDLIPLMELGKLGKDEAVAEFLFARAEVIWKSALGASPFLSGLRNVDRHELVKNFAQLEKERRSDCVKVIRASHLGQVPQGAHGAMAIIRGEIAKKRAHIPLRKLFSNAAEAIQRIKPVLMMSPISVAQFLPPGSISFDLLIIDEASQVRPEDALGAIARAKQIVVVGDQKQLPPSSFFDRLANNGDENDDEEDNLLEGAARVGELESILTLCEARGLNSRMLEWHYRSRDPSLIRVSNHEFYRDGLILPPSPLQNDPSYGLIFSRIAGIYDRGGKRDNRLEGEAIVKRVVEHAEAMPTLSLGIVTFSSAQRNLITELLEYQRRQDPVLDTFLRDGCIEDVFVKNIENVQGDERDVILVSVGYGPTEAGGRPNMTFGPVNKDGGERRLNVMFTRARVRCEVFCSFDPGDMNLTKTGKEGPKILKRFLEFAKTGMIDDKAPTGEGPDTPFEADVAAAIEGMGYSVDHQVGSAGFLIDLGIRHPERPGTYILAVECDGATYHSALWARERDRLRQDVLENLGWRFHRIWSTDWFYRRAQELDRLRNALTDAQIASEKGIVIKGANENASAVVAPLIEQRIEANEAPQRTMPLYSKSAISIQTKQEPHEVDLGSLARLAFRVVEIEGPIHEEEIARRVAAAFGKEKAGSRIIGVVQRALKHAARLQETPLQQDDGFWFTKAQSDEPPVRDRSLESGPICKAANISMLEIKQALRLTFEDNAGGSDPEIIRAAARLFGFRRVGPDLQARLEIGLRNLQ